MRTLMVFGLGAAALLAIGCGGAPEGGTGGGGNSGAPGNGGGGSAATGGNPQGGGGGNPQGTGGGSQGNGFDDGKLFQDAGPVTAPPVDAGPGPADGGPKPDAGPGGPPPDGTMATAKIGTLGLAAVFTQKGTDVTLVVTATKCPAGMHVFRIHEGFACDDPTNKPVWGGKRGDGITPLVCGADQKGTFTYTRTGTDPTTKWTVGDQSLMTDVTLHPIFVDASCGTFF